MTSALRAAVAASGRPARRGRRRLAASRRRGAGRARARRGRGARCWSATSLAPTQARTFAALVDRRAAREPLQHLTGRRVLPAPRARRRPGRVRAAAGDRGGRRGWRSTRPVPVGAGARSSSTCAPGRARSRWRSPTRCPARGCTPSSADPDALRLGGAQPAPGLGVDLRLGDAADALRRARRHRRRRRDATRRTSRSER